MGSKFSSTRPRQRPPAVCQKGPPPNKPVILPPGVCPPSLPDQLTWTVQWNQPTVYGPIVFTAVVPTYNTGANVWLGFVTGLYTLGSTTVTVLTTVRYGWNVGTCIDGIDCDLIIPGIGTICQTGEVPGVYPGGLPFARDWGTLPTDVPPGTCKVSGTS